MVKKPDAKKDKTKKPPKAARPPKAKPAPAAAAKTEGGDELSEGKIAKSSGPVRAMISANDLNKLLKRGDASAENIDLAVSEWRTELQKAKDKKHLHTGAFALIRRLRKMSTARLDEFMAHFDYYFDACGLDDKLKNEPNLPGTVAEPDEVEDEGDETETEAANAKDDGKVVKPQFGGPKADVVGLEPNPETRSADTKH